MLLPSAVNGSLFGIVLSLRNIRVIRTLALSPPAPRLPSLTVRAARILALPKVDLDRFSEFHAIYSLPTARFGTILSFRAAVNRG